MRLATIRVPGGTRAVRIDGGQAIETGHPDVGALLAAPGWHDRAAAAGGERHPPVRWTSARWCRGPARLSAWG
jgi:acylpyruvate hydrolase